MNRITYSLTLGLLMWACATASAQPFFIFDTDGGPPDDFDPINDPEDYILLNTPLSVGPTSVSYFRYDYEFSALCLIVTAETQIGFVQLTEPFGIEVFGGISEFSPDGTSFTLFPNFGDQELSPGEFFNVIHSTEFTLEAGCFVPEPTSYAMWVTALTALLMFRFPSQRRHLRCRGRPASLG